MMKRIEIPSEFMGVPVSEDTLKEALSPTRTQQRKQTTPNTNAPSLDGFEYVPFLGLYVGKEKELHGKNWDDAREELHQRGDRMPTISEYVTFINHLRSKDDAEAKQILDEIYGVRNPWRSEWLDAKFSVTGGLVRMGSYAFTDTGVSQTYVYLPNVLMQDKKPGIDLDSWLRDNEHGVSKEGISDGKLWYWPPRDGTVARFDADSNGADLDCGGDPIDSYSSLGVRAVRRANAQNSGGSN
jgi:hypothetical protein